MAPSPLPEHVYKIIPSAPPSPIPDRYPLSDLDKNDGFVHLSTADQIPTTLSLFFKETANVWVLKLRFTFADKVTYENGDGCPHLHGNFGAADVEDAREFSRNDGETWQDALKRQGGWLV
ncbi:hypothetical protein BKA67DRAFT_657402 [Truncatella angustata]|uniref:DUF952 domain-containing protein n=1 Tax=Truncatella angustata TaxID=152316 RepID=A0A9P8ZZX6_9PEZI|nr:uncharacterized protein BKA67DRAFT_657402 [Truncatella angustata]KAH6655464.1 hypothetical protein BKA67DRAFT_657402 [Truncatella angustata]KAH8202844.1 hypothetical protein TruAng_003007 [Truncatella angustata]